jgi:hypothetical protein
MVESFEKKVKHLKKITSAYNGACTVIIIASKISNTCTQSLLVANKLCQGRITCAVCVNILVIE